MEKEDIIKIKVFLLGENSGKKKFIRLIKGEYYMADFNIIGLRIIEQLIEYKNQLIKIILFDTEGQERFRNFRSLFNISAAIFLIYSINSIKSFMFLENIELEKSIKPIKILIGIDDEKERNVSYEQGDNFSKKLNIPFFEINVKKSENADEVFFKLIELYFNEHNITKKINNNNMDYFLVNYNLNICSNCHPFFVFTNSIKFYNVRLKNMKKYPISFITLKDNNNLGFVDGGIYIVNLWNIEDFYNLKKELNNGLPDIPKMILGLYGKKERKINKKEIMNLAKIFKIAYFEMNLLNGQGYEIAFQYLTMEMLSNTVQRKNNTNSDSKNTKIKDKCEIY